METSDLKKSLGKLKALATKAEKTLWGEYAKLEKKVEEVVDEQIACLDDVERIIRVLPDRMFKICEALDNHLWQQEEAEKLVKKKKVASRANIHPFPFRRER